MFQLYVSGVYEHNILLSFLSRAYGLLAPQFLQNKQPPYGGRKWNQHLIYSAKGIGFRYCDSVEQRAF